MCPLPSEATPEGGSRGPVACDSRETITGPPLPADLPPSRLFRVPPVGLRGGGARAVAHDLCAQRQLRGARPPPPRPHSDHSPGLGRTPGGSMRVDLHRKHLIPSGPLWHYSSCTATQQMMPDAHYPGIQASGSQDYNQVIIHTKS